MQAVLISVVPEHGKRRHFGKLPFQRTFNYGLLSVASVAVQNGYDVDVWDTADPAFSDDGALGDALRSAAPSVVGLSCISGFSYPRMLRLSSTIRRTLPNSTIVVGGMDHVGRIPLLVLDEAPEVDAVVSGYGEMPFLAVLDAKRSNSRSISAPGVTTRDHSEVAIGLDKLAPLPNLDYRRYLGLRSLPASVELARGCPFSCAFCISAGGSLKRRTPTDLAEQMLQACIAYDDARLRLYLEAPIATFGKDYLKSLRAELSARGISPTWRAESRVDVLRPELVDELAESGCRVLDLGLESASPKVLAWMQKTLNPPDYLRRSAELLGALAQADIFSKVNVLFYAGETIGTVTETRDFLFERKSVRAVGALEWILTQQLYEHAWGPSSEHSGSVYVTALVCQVLRAFGYAPGQAKLDGALKWLFGARNDDGGWGKKHRDGESNAWCTSHALMALHDRGQISPEPNSVPGVSWLRANASSWSSLISEEYFVHSPSLGKVDVRYEFQPLPLVLIALDHAGIRPLAPDVFRATDDLLRHERDGVWIWPSSSRKTIFNLCHSVQAMMAVRERFNHAESIRAMLALRSIDEKAVSSRTLEQSNWSFKNVTFHLSLNWRRYSAGALGILGMAVMLTILMPTGSFEAIWSASSNALIKVTQSPNLSAAAAVAIGVAATVLWRWRLMWLVGYLGLILTLYLYLKQGEGGVLSVVGSIAATLVTLGAVFWLQKREK